MWNARFSQQSTLRPEVSESLNFLSLLLRRASAKRRTSQLLTGQWIVLDLESIAPKRSALLALS
jgi:hypothetical protein